MEDASTFHGATTLESQRGFQLSKEIHTGGYANGRLHFLSRPRPGPGGDLMSPKCHAVNEHKGQ